jgi:hypothetical protein
LFFLLKITNYYEVGVGGEQCFWRFHNVFSNPFPTIAAHLSASKFSHFTYVSSLEFSLLS